MKYVYVVFNSRPNTGRRIGTGRRFILEIYQETVAGYCGRIVYCSDNTIPLNKYTVIRKANKKINFCRFADSVEVLMRDNFEDFL